MRLFGEIEVSAILADKLVDFLTQTQINLYNPDRVTSLLREVKEERELYICTDMVRNDEMGVKRIEAMERFLNAAIDWVEACRN